MVRSPSINVCFCRLLCPYFPLVVPSSLVGLSRRHHRHHHLGHDDHLPQNVFYRLMNVVCEHTKKMRESDTYTWLPSVRARPSLHPSHRHLRQSLSRPLTRHWHRNRRIRCLRLRFPR